MRMASASFVVLLLAGCEQLLDIKPAEIDPELGGGAGSTTGTGGQEPLDDSGALGSGASAAQGSGSQANNDPDAGSAGGSSGEGGSPSDAGDAGTSLCEVYCDAVMSECTGEFAVYTRRENCLAVCQAFPSGTPNDNAGNTLYCRLRAARSAATELPYYCPAAGPAGNGVCGTNCESMCHLAEQLCVGSNRQFADESACLAACQVLPDLGSYTTNSAAAQYSGPHVQCRLFHASNAAVDPGAHCAHVGGAKPCQ